MYTTLISQHSSCTGTTSSQPDEVKSEGTLTTVSLILLQPVFVMHKDDSTSKDILNHGFQQHTRETAFLGYIRQDIPSLRRPNVTLQTNNAERAQCCTPASSNQRPTAKPLGSS
eukprot:scpid11928/ scgid33582/ 